VKSSPPTDISTLSLHDALPISPASATANTCSTFVGLSSTAAAARPLRTASNAARGSGVYASDGVAVPAPRMYCTTRVSIRATSRSEEHTSELQSRGHLVCRLLL